MGMDDRHLHAGGEFMPWGLSLSYRDSFCSSFRQTEMDIPSHHLQIMFCSYVLIIYLNTKVSRTTSSSLWVHLAGHAVPHSQKPHQCLWKSLCAGCLVTCRSVVHSLLWLPFLAVSTSVPWLSPPGSLLCTAWGFCSTPPSPKVCPHVLAAGCFVNKRCVCRLCCFLLQTQFSHKRCPCTGLVMRGRGLVVCSDSKCLAPVKGKTVF